MPMVLLMLGLVLSPLMDSRKTGSRRFLAKDGSRFCASMDRWSPSSTKPGVQIQLSYSSD